MGNFKRHGVLVALMIIFLLVASLFGGYKFVTRVNPEVDQKFNEIAKDTLGVDIEAQREKKQAEKRQEEQKKEESGKNYTYKAQNSRSYDGPVIHMAGTYLINTDGKILKDFYKEDGYRLDLSKNIDGSEAVLVSEKELFYIDADLNVTKIADDVKSAGMCYQGGYFYYVQSEGGDPYQISIYDVAAKKSNRISDADITSVAISPDGRTVAFYRLGDKKELLCCSIGEQPRVLDSGKRVSPIAVSTGGQTVFYESFDNSDEVFCMHDGKRTRISRKYIHTAYFDRDCTQILFEEPEKIRYYRAGDKTAVTLNEHAYFNYNIFNTGCMETESGSKRYIIDTDCFADVMTIDDYSHFYCLRGETPTLVEFGDKNTRMYNPLVVSGDIGPGYTYIRDNSVCRSVYDGNSEKSEVIWDGSDNTANSFAASADTGEIWVSSYTDKAIYYSSNGQDFIKVTDDEYKPSYEMRWNPLDGKCYYISDDKLYSVGDGSEQPKLVAEDVSWYTYMSSDFDAIVYKSSKDDENFIVLFDEILPAR